MDRQTDGADCVAFLAIAVGNYFESLTPLLIVMRHENMNF